MNEKDTSRQAQEVLTDIYRHMPITVKVMRIFEAYQTGKILAMAGLRQLHPKATKRRIWYLWAKCHLGKQLFNSAYGVQANE